MRKQRLKELLKEVDRYELKGDGQQLIDGIAIDSRNVDKGFLFAALKGTTIDGHEYISKAIENKASAIICEEWPSELRQEVVYVKVDDSRIAIGIIASTYYDHPSRKLKCVGVTGTNGKTTVTTLLYNLFKELGYKVGLISTIEILVNEKKSDAVLTTPDVISLHRLLFEMVNDNCSHVFMEVSSHASDQKRISGLRFEGGIFTNLSHDHLDYHGSFKNYIKAKQSFFESLSKDAFALTNIDDKNGLVMIQNTSAKCYNYSMRELTDFKSKLISEETIGMHVDINGQKFITRLAGKFNVSNLTAVYGAAKLMENIKDDILIEKISGLKTAIGRMETVSFFPRVIVDYAHTPDALENVLNTLIASRNSGRIITVVGCGGDRDKGKRPIMGLLALEKSDIAIFTSDNPRSEDPEQIIRDMKLKIEKTAMTRLLEIADRKAAIKTALTIALKEDTILIAGKGHEQYQEINGKKHFFSDQEIVKDILSEDI